MSRRAIRGSLGGPGSARDARRDRGRRRDAWGIALALGAAIVALLVLGCAPAPESPRLVYGPSVGSDLRSLAAATWDRFLTAFAARRDCFGDVTLVAAYELASRSSYDPDTAVVSVRVPATAAMLQGALVHEWAHHIEYQCEAQRDLRPRFLAAQGLSPTTPWRPAAAAAQMPADEWAAIPAEQCAEATIEFVLGRRQIPTTARVTIEAVQVIADWAAGH